MDCVIGGYTISGIAGLGGSGAVLRGCSEAGQEVAVRIVPPEHAAQVRRAAERLLGSRIAGCAVPRECVELTSGELAVVSDFVPGPALATARAARRGFTAPECLQLGFELLAALVCLHELGHLHGDISPANIILRPGCDEPERRGTAEAVLVDFLHAPGEELGTRGFRAPEVAAGDPAGRGADVYALAQVCLWVAQPDARRDVARQLEPLLAADPARRPSARTAQELLRHAQRVAIVTPPHEALAAASLREHAMRAPTTRAPGRAPGRRGGGGKQRAPTRARHRARRRRGWSVLVAVLVAVALGAVLWVGLPFGGSPQQPTATQPSGSGADGGLAEAVRELVAARDHALQAGDEKALAALTAPDSPLRQSDAQLMRRLQQAEVRLGEYRTQVSDIEVLTRQDGDAEVQLVLQQLAHHRSSRAEQYRIPAQDPHCLHLQLQRTSQQWVAVSAEPCQ